MLINYCYWHKKWEQKWGPKRIVTSHGASNGTQFIHREF